MQTQRSCRVIERYRVAKANKIRFGYCGNDGNKTGKRIYQQFRRFNGVALGNNGR